MALFLYLALACWLMAAVAAVVWFARAIKDPRDP